MHMISILLFFTIFCGADAGHCCFAVPDGKRPVVMWDEKAHLGHYYLFFYTGYVKCDITFPEWQGEEPHKVSQGFGEDKKVCEAVAKAADSVYCVLKQCVGTSEKLVKQASEKLGDALRSGNPPIADKTGRFAKKFAQDACKQITGLNNLAFKEYNYTSKCVEEEKNAIKAMETVVDWHNPYGAEKKNGGAEKTNGGAENKNGAAKPCKIFLRRLGLVRRH
mmetsp:Transcript_98772/g.279846  ORF Transcript_98772/g.279846 Transcript_98772/m.279846 type:complete len:221 (+) Transcript_98772:65-727(+)